MNYWLLTTEYPPFYGGGISTYCYHTCCMLSEQGHQVTVFVNDKTVDTFLIRQSPEARIVRFNPSGTKADLFLGDITHLSYEFAEIIKKFIEKEGKPDMIECQDYNGIGYFLLQFRACLYEWCRNIPVVVTMHSPSFLYLEYNEAPLYKKPNFWIAEMEKFCIQAADLLISPSHYLITEIKKRFTIRNENLHVVPNPFRFTSAGNPEISEAVISGNALTFYGKLSPQKGSFKILEQFQQLWSKGLNVPLVMIGGQDIVFHPLEKTMGEIIKQRYAAQLHNGLLKLQDKINPDDRAQLLAECFIFLVPSIVDNLPYAVLELMSLGKLLIVSGQGGQAEIVQQGKSGFIFDYNKAGDFENVLTNVLALPVEERRVIAQQAIKRIQTGYAYECIYPLKIKLLEGLKKRYQEPNQFPFIRQDTTSNIPIDAHQESCQLLSVVVPYYNLGNYLDDTITSILNSSYEEIEVIILNDGSTDAKSIQKLEAYRHHQKIRVIDKPNTGLADTRNAGAEQAKGKFLAFLDADDMVAPDYYKKAIQLLTHYSNVHVVGAWTKYFGNSTAVWPTFNPEPPLILVHNTINSSSLVYVRQAFLSAGKNDKAFKIGLEDYESVIALKANGMNGVAIPEVLFYYRVRKNSMIKSVDKEVRATYHQKIAEKYKPLFSEFQKEVEQLGKANGAALSYDNSTLDALPFQNIPLIATLVKKMIVVIKSRPLLKKRVLWIKRLLRR